MSSRRVFLKSGALSLVAFGALPRVLVRGALAATRRRTLVVLFQRGACDGLNTVVPYGDGEYRRLRPTIAIPAPRGGSREAALDLDGHFGLHPALEPLLPLWRDRALAVVHAVGSPDPTRSHFDAQDFMESGTPGRKGTGDGWLNRHLCATPAPAATPFRGLSMTANLPRILAGTAPATALRNARDFKLRTSSQTVARGFEELYEEASQAALQGAGRDTFEALDFLQRQEREGTRAAGRGYPRGEPGEALAQLAQLIKADAGVEVGFVETGGWDHHAAEGGVNGQLANRLRNLGRALAAFHADLGSRMSDVVVVTLTEFGRTARENGTRGTDHGHGSVALVLGGGVDGGRVHGRWPGLRTEQLYDGRDLAVTTDFRDLVGELLASHLGAKDLVRVFPGHTPRPVGVMRS
jgi:uncharacterized protein (DUF1501 family)